MFKSDSLTKLAPDLVLAIAEVENATKNASNPGYKSRYANLAEIVNVSKPILAKYNLALVQLPGLIMPANPEADTYATLESVLLHSSGEFLGGVAAAPLAKTDPQGVGSALTYLRRYAAAAALGMAQEDDDGNAASKAPKAQSGQKPVTIKVADLVTAFNAAKDQKDIDATRAIAKKLPPEAQTDELVSAFEAAQARVTPSKES